MCGCVWVVWHLADWCYYLSLPLLYLKHLLKKCVCCVFLCDCRPVIHVQVFMQVHISAELHILWTRVCMCDRSLNCCVVAGSLLCVCLTFRNCIITRSVSFCKKWVRRNLQHMLQADRHLPLIMDLGGMASSSGCLDSPQHVWRHMLLWVNLIDWMAPNSQVQVSSGSQSESVQVKDELRRWSLP